MADKHHLSFSIGPVQTFVAQARRTRDLWAGSILLSWLAESALVAVEKQFKDRFDNRSATTIIPDRSISRGQFTSIESGAGGIPNRFEIAFDSSDNAAEAAASAVQGFHTAWAKVCDQVWQLVRGAAKNGNATEAIWKRQVESFWELSWIVASPASQRKTIGDIAATRKLIRNVKVTEEGGVKCSLMHEWQELSGFNRSNQQKEFWQALRNCPGVGSLDIRDGERLCAMALIKRFLPAVDEQVFGRSLKQKHWPSTAFLAAIPWLRKVHENSKARFAAETFVDAARKAGIQQSEAEAASDAQVFWAKIDGPAWSIAGLSNNEWGIPEADKNILTGKLRELYKLAGERIAGERIARDRKPVPFYGLLLMDGDSMGKLLEAIGNPTVLSRCLNHFTKGVNKTIQAHGGRTVYAGGDDVLALLPATDALLVADLLSHQYQQAFAEALNEKPNVEATISAAIVYAHWKQPLRQVLQHAHRLLDDVAKNTTGRDALAIGVVKGSGLNAQWSAPWEVIRKTIVGKDSIIHRFKGSSSSGAESEPSFNASFVYHLRDQFSRLLNDTVDQPGSFGLMHETAQSADDEQSILLALANAEYRRRLIGEDRKRSLQDTQDAVRPLVELSQRIVRGEPVDSRYVGFDGWRVARFLKQISDGEMQDHE